MKMKKPGMVTQIMIAVVLGLVFGLLFGEFSKSLKVIGDIFLRLIQMSIAQLYGIQYGVDRILYIGVVSALVSLANAVLPGAGLVSLASIVPQMGMPLESIALFAGVERFVGMLRTILNVNSDGYTAILVAKGADEIDDDAFYGHGPKVVRKDS
jgi:Na+/H+-dicarboxylate symporter